jgi:hypothetical protein
LLLFFSHSFNISLKQQAEGASSQRRLIVFTANSCYTSLGISIHGFTGVFAALDIFWAFPDIGAAPCIIGIALGTRRMRLQKEDAAWEQMLQM